ncbi:T9SS type A sorting domain-containing protein [Hymenobacter sp. 15J16-1T3B]|uniref:T9SS type A sorting domain-containing protein n=1 Tax=Hymenobacter sp. 15J16-1T3B TaxID=2886941 RepID=UPI001D112969|nr:T9SS type A sorting domain-containing protein [Hymenobacter sp. 15J16-1T3B]MCC3159475.1 T9SS type A sorting domain-containing protein [Hymenobacter sp. 15J16-1T3B]
MPAGFQGSTDNTTFTANTGTTLTLARSGNSVTATIYLRFAPSQAISYDDFLEVTSRGNGNVALASDVEVIGTGTPPPPVITVSPAALGFGGQVINTTSAPQNITVTGASLTTSITAVAPTGFLVSYNGGAYGTTATLPSTGGTLNVVFAPTQTGNYVGDVTFNSTGAAQQTVSVSGTGQAAPVVLTVNPNSLTFPNTTVGQASASQSFTVNATGLTGNVTITAPSNFQVRVGSNPFNSTATITPVNGSVSNVTVDVRFTPTTNGNISQTVVVSSPGATSQNVAVSGTGNGGGGGATVSVTPTSITFGNVTQSGSADTRTLTVGGINLGTTPLTLTPSSSNIQLRNASAGGSFVSGPLTLTPVNGTVSPTTIEVRLVAPIAGGAFSQTITAASGSATPVVVTVSATSNGNVSDISITNPANNTFTFATRPATFSVSQSFLISGTNLLQDITVFPAGTSGSYFQVSTDNVNFFSSVTLTRDGQNNVPQQAIYVRFVPGNQAITVNALIRATSSPAPDRDVSVTGISEPTIRLLQPLGSFGDATVKNTKSAAKTIRLETFLLTGPLNLYFPNDTEDPGRNPVGTPQYEFEIVNGGNPTNQSANNGYTYADTLLNNADGNRIVNLLVRYAPTRVGAATQELTFTNQALNNNQPLMLLSGNGRASGFAIAEEPTAQSTAQIVRPTGSTTATITFDLGNPPAGTTYGQNRLVIASRTYTLLPTSLFPVDKSNFNPGTTVNGAYQYGTGTLIEASTGTYVVFSGAANSFTVGNLDPNENYYFFAFEFNDDGLLNAENYKVPNNQPQTPLPVELVSFTAKLRNGRVQLNWLTAQEKNNRGFEVQRSQNGRDFQTIGFVAGRGNTTVQTEYSSEDAQPLMGVSYYRLRQLDTDGTPHILPAVSIRNGGKLEAAVYPNPVTDKLTIRVSGASSEATVQVTDLMGRAVLSGKLALDGGFDMSRLKSGTYVVTISSGDEKVSHKVIKQ